jgi:hypothetical protein
MDDPGCRQWVTLSERSDWAAAASTRQAMFTHSVDTGE